MDPQVAERLFDTEVGAMRKQARFNGGGYEIVSAAYPDLLVRLPHPQGSRLFRFHCDDWDEQPPSVKSVDQSGNELQEPAGDLFMSLSSGFGLCAPGTREYHGHHAEDPWSAHQGSLSLAEIVLRVASHYRRAAV